MIPKVLHFIWINESRDFGEGEYASIQSALRNTSYDVVLHTNILQGTINSPYDPYSIFSPRFSICFDMFADYSDFKMPVGALSDIYRVKILYDEGGIYSDTDILWFKDTDVDLSACNFVGSYENDHPRYRTVVNGLMASAPGFAPLLTLIKEMESIIAKHKSRGVYDIRDLKRSHWTFFKISTEFVKIAADVMLPQKDFFRNGFRRIGRNLMAKGVVLRPHAASLVAKFNKSKTPVQLDGITGFHYYNYLYDFSDILQLDGLREKLQQTELPDVPEHTSLPPLE